MKPRTVIVGDHEDPKDDTTHPIVFEQYLDGRQRDRMPAGRIATLDFELGGDPSEPHVVIASDDGQNAKSGALVWETVLIPGKHTRGESLRHAAMLERRYGACTIARLVLPPELRFVMAEALATPRASPPEPANVEGCGLPLQTK